MTHTRHSVTIDLQNMLTVAFDQYREAQEMIERGGAVYLAPPDSRPIASPYIEICNRLTERILKLSKELGLSPAK